MIKKIFNYIKEFVVEEYKFLICMLIFYIVCTFPVNYYIVTGGGISDVGERIEVTDGSKSKGSFNLSYVSELKGTVLTYGLSYIFPSWERDNMSDYKYSETETYEDIEFRGELDLESTNGSATKVAYELAGKKVEEISSKIYVIALFDEFETEFKIRDELLSVDGKSFDTVDEYSKYVQKFDVGESIKIKVLRNGKEKTINCKLHEEQGRKIFGVALQISKKYKTDPKIDITFKPAEAGPSGGLITTLEIYDKLVDEDITKGLTIAGTGTVDENGNVGEIGGVRYKVIGAEDGGADVFLVPAGENYKEAVKVKKDKDLKIKIIEVKTVKEAIEKLSKLKKQ